MFYQNICIVKDHFLFFKTPISAGAWTRSRPSGAEPWSREGTRPSREGEAPARKGAGERKGAREGEDAAERRMGAGPDEARWEGKAKDASSSRHQGEERWGQTETTLSNQPSSEVSNIFQANWLKCMHFIVFQHGCCKMALWRHLWKYCQHIDWATWLKFGTQM